MTEPILFNIHQAQKSSRGQIEERKFKMIVGKSGDRWFVGTQQASADDIYVEGGKNSQGMAGATCPFLLEDGETINIQGPWKTSADALFKDTGYDARDRYTTRGIVALRKEHAKKFYDPDLFFDVLHFDEDFIIGDFNRIKNIAQKFSNDLGKNVYYSYVSDGGGCGSWADPQVEK